MPLDILGDGLSALCIVENEDEEKCPLEETYKIERTSTKFKSNLSSEVQDDHSCYYNYGIGEAQPTCNSQTHKTKSLPASASLSQPWIQSISSARHVSPEDIANQLTLLDLECFKAIRAEELISCGWNKLNKLAVAPNVVAFTKRFNRVSFWTAQEILMGTTPKTRSESLAHFIKIAKKLYDLNNIHSLFAVVSALQTASIFRLSKTWGCLSKKDKSVFDKLAELFIDKDNWSALREHVCKQPLPCIPYLGIFLTDLVYINIAHPPGSSNCATKMAVILKALEKYQQSHYDIELLPHVSNYLNSVRYIEELQKFVEDDQYKLSLKLEPPTPGISRSNSKESMKDLCSYGNSASFSMSPSHRATSASLRPCSPGQKFMPTHRKCRSLGSNIFSKTYSEGSANKVTPTGSVNLLDDTFLEAAVIPTDKKTFNPQRLMPAVHELPGYQSFVRRKTVLKNGKRPSLCSWQRYWLILCTSSLIYFSPKSFKGTRREDYRNDPSKMCPLEGWIAMWVDGESSDVFQLINHQAATLYKFRTGSERIAREWVSKIQEVTLKVQKPLPVNLMSFE